MTGWSRTLLRSAMNAGLSKTKLTGVDRHGQVWRDRDSAVLDRGVGGFWHYHLAWKAIAVWYAVNAFISVCNTMRTLGAHRYESTGLPLDRAGQLADSIDTPGAAWTELWAPVGLRYHALHHYFPGIPYHNLGLAYRR